jgi:hypothetical protein
MKIIALSEAESSFYGFTHRANISFAGGDFTAAATTQTYTLMTLAAGMLVKKAALRLITALSGGAVSACVALVGKTGTTNAYVTSTNVFTGSTIITKAGDGASFNQACGEAFDAASALIVTITTTGANVNALTAGEINVFFSVVDLLKL